MTITVPSARIASAECAPARAEARATYRGVGLVIATILPAAFWTGVVGLSAAYFAEPLATATLAMIGSSIAAFLYVICAAVMTRA